MQKPAAKSDAAKWRAAVEATRWIKPNPIPFWSIKPPHNF